MSGIKNKLLLLFIVALLAAASLSGLLVDIFGKKQEARLYPLMNLKVSDEDVNPEKWGLNFPYEYDSYARMVETNAATEFGGSLPYSKLLRYPQLTRLWAGYPFSADFNEERGHYYSQIDQMETKRNDKAWLNAHGFPKFTGQPGACMNCHSGWTPQLIRELGWETFNKTPYIELAEKIKAKHGEGIHANQLGGTCADCHSPEDMSLRVTRPAYINAMVTRGYQADPKSGLVATRQEMRSHVCQQCHVEYYFQKGSYELTFPWADWPKDQPLRIEMIEKYYDRSRTDKEKFQQDWMHKESGAAMLKMQHPETELNSSGIHARSGVSCADCHMPYVREGSVKVTNHHIQSPLHDVSSSCQSCHPMAEAKILARVKTIQESTAQSLREAEKAILALVDDIKAATEILKATDGFKQLATPETQEAFLSETLSASREFHRRASMRWDFIASENSTGFHSPQESARVLAQAIDLARQGQITLVNSLKKKGLEIPTLTTAGAIPAPGSVIPEAKAPVGQLPPADLVALDKNIVG